MDITDFKLWKDEDLNYPLIAGDLKVSLDQISKSELTKTVYFGAIDGYDASNQNSIRKVITLGENTAFLWTFVKNIDDGQGGQIEVPAVDFIKNVAITAPDEDIVTEFGSTTEIANFFYRSEQDKKITTTDDHTLWGMFNIGEYKFGWSTSSNAEAGGFRIAKRDPGDPANEIIMTRSMRYGAGVNNPDRFTTFEHGDDLPTDGWYVKDFWAYTYPNQDNDDTLANDIIPKMTTLQSGVPNAIRIDITFGLPDGYSSSTQDFSFMMKILPMYNVSLEEVTL